VLAHFAGGADFMVICSDVIYPAGDANDYVDGFYIPYRDVPLPVYALPGNHDWYDSLNGFMWNFCGADRPPAQLHRPEVKYTWKERLARRLWSPASRPRYDRLVPLREERAEALGSSPWAPLQPGPYFAIELAHVLLVCVDSGISGPIDADQAAWLVEVSASSEKPKVLLPGKPLIDKMERHPGEFDGGAVSRDGVEFASVDDVVRHEPFGYVAAIGGDTHNFQHYEVGAFHYIVSGGGGAYLSATHTIPPPSALDADVTAFESYPTRTDSLVYFSRLMVPRLWQLVLWVVLATAGVGVAAAVVAALDDNGATIDAVLLAAVGVLALRALAIVFRTGDGAARAVRPTAAQRAAGYATALLGGFTFGLAGWWAAPEEFGTNATYLAALTAGGFVIALLLRATGWWRSRLVAQIVIAAQAAGALTVLVLLLIHAEVVGWQAAVTALAVVVALPAVPLAVDAARRRFPCGYKHLLLGAAAAAVVVLALPLADTWVPRALVAAIVLVAAAVLGIAIAHLNFFNAFSLLYRWNMHSGTLDETEAGAIIEWRSRSDAPRPRSGRTRGIANMVYPGSRNPSGPIQKLVSEIFDSDFPPFRKHFLLVESDSSRLKVSCIQVTGEETGAATIAPPQEIDIGLEPRTGRDA
jgi:hypothetical protein